MKSNSLKLEIIQSYAKILLDRGDDAKKIAAESGILRQ